MRTIKTFMAKPADVERDWVFFDADGQVVGRLATKIATLLMGKHRPIYTPHVDTGDYVVVVNVEKVVFTGKKWDQKRYTWYTGWPGLRSETAGQRRDRQPERILTDAVRRMLPKNKLGRQMLQKLKVYVGNEHPHQAQNPRPYEATLSNGASKDGAKKDGAKKDGAKKDGAKKDTVAT